MRVHLGSDHAGYDLKAALVARLTELGHEPVDHGPTTYDALDDYPPFVLRAAEAVAHDPGSLGVVVGGSRNGEAIAANQLRGVRAALAWSDDTAALGREHDAANLVSIGARMHTRAEATHLVEVFLDTPFSGSERHQRRIEMLARYESTGELPALPAPPLR